MYGNYMLCIPLALTWVSNVNLLSMTIPSDLFSDDTGRLTLVTDTVLTPDANCNGDDDPTNIAVDLSAFNNKSLSAN